MKRLGDPVPSRPARRPAGRRVGAVLALVVAAAPAARSERPFVERLVDALLEVGEAPVDPEPLVRERRRECFEIFHGYLDGAFALDRQGSRNRMRLSWRIGERLAPLYDRAYGGSALRDALERCRRLRAERAAEKVAADEERRAAEEAVRSGRPAEALLRAREAAALYGRIGDPRGEGLSRLLLGRLLLAGGREERAAEPDAARELEAAARRLEVTGDGWRAGEALLELGAWLQLAERYGEARSRYEEARGAFEEAGDENAAWRARANLAGVLASCGEPQRALEELAACERWAAGAGDLPLQAHLRAQRGAAHLLAGEPQEAVGSYLEALGLLPEAGGGERACRERSRVTWRLGVAYEELGLLEWARTRLEEALALDARCPGESLGRLIRESLARLAIDAGEPERAGALLEPLASAAGGPGVSTRRLLAACRLARGESGGGRLLAEARREAAARGLVLEEGMTSVELGDLLRRDRRYGEAREAYGGALERAGAYPEVAWRAWSGLGALAQEGGEEERALEAYRRAVAIQEGLLAGVASPRLGAAILERREEPYLGLIALLLRRSEAGGALQVAARLQSRLAAARFAPGRGALFTRLAPELAREIERAWAALDAARRSGGGAGEDLRQRYRELLVRADLARPGVAALLGAPPPLDLEEVQGALARAGARVAVLAYLVVPEGVHVWALSARGLRYHPVALSGRDLERCVEAFRAPFARYQEGVLDLSHLAFDTSVARRLYEALVEPAAADLERTERLVVVPDGVLHHLPFEALVVSGTPGPVDHGSLFREYRGPRYLVERWAVSYAPSVELAALALGRSGPAAGEALVLADPARPAAPPPRSGVLRSPPGSGLPRRRAPLPSARAEAAAIRRLLGPGTVVLAGPEATEAALRARSRSAGLVHLAAHAWVDDRAPLFSGVELAPGGGADGLLEGHEVLRLDLEGQLVVLSGCETARGPLRRGEGLSSLARAFLETGARAVVASLWRVDDSAALFMEELYRELAAGSGAGEALRRAKVRLLREREGRGFSYALPYFWAPFVLIEG